MDPAVIAVIVPVAVTLIGLIVTHLLGQKSGEKRANQVREDLMVRMTDMEQALTKSIEAVDRRLDDFKLETKDRLGVLHGDLTDLKDELERAKEQGYREKQDLKELFRAELRAATAEIRGAVAGRTRRAGDPEQG